MEAERPEAVGRDDAGTQHEAAAVARQHSRRNDMDLFDLVESTPRLTEAAGGLAARESSLPVGPGRRESQARLIPRFDLSELATSAESMLGWCHAMEKYGVAVVRTTNASGVLKTFTELFGFREWCSYGEFYVVENKQTVPTHADAPIEQANNLCENLS